MIKLHNISLHQGSKILLENINFSIQPKDKIGIVGPNGCGKTSLVSLIQGQLQPSEGEIIRHNHIRISHLAQEIQASNITALDYVLDGDQMFRHIEAQIKIAEKQHAHQQLAELHGQFQEIDGYSKTAVAARLLHGLGFQDQEIQQSVSAFSGGWRMRLNLAKTLMTPADIILLDEPTNHLDIEAIIWLEKWLQRFPGCIVIISHDRDFLDNIVNHIAHFDHKSLKRYKGHYSDFEKLRAQQLALEQALYTKQQKQKQHMTQFINRFRAKSSKAKQVQSRIKSLEKMQTISLAHSDSEFEFSFLTPLKQPKPLLTLDKVSIGYAEKILIKRLNLSIHPGDRIGLLGKNGCGKTTLLKTLANIKTPLSGTITPSTGLCLGYFDQHQVDHLCLEQSPVQHLQSLDNKAPEQSLRKFLGSFGFSGDEALRPITYFSGGEKTRLALALVCWQRPNLLLLDEPTNHLDLDMCHALTLALQAYQGAMLIVSHDRNLLRVTCDKLCLVHQQQLQDYSGDVDDYIHIISKNNSQIKPAVSTSSTKNRHPQYKTLQNRLKTIEKKTTDINQALHAIEQQLATTELYEASNQTQLQTLLTEQKTLQQQLATLEEEWISILEELEQ